MFIMNHLFETLTKMFMTSLFLFYDFLKKKDIFISCKIFSIFMMYPSFVLLKTKQNKRHVKGVKIWGQHIYKLLKITLGDR